MLANPKYKMLPKNYNHLTGVVMNGTDKKPELSVHIIFGTCDYSKIKTDARPKVGKSGQSIN